MINIFSIVEGHGEISAVPILIRRIANEICGRFDVACLPPYRLPRGRMLIDLTRVIALGRAQLAGLEGDGHIVIIMDADEECPATLATTVRNHCRDVWDDETIKLIFACQEYEAWFLASNMNVNHHRDLRDETPTLENPEVLRSPKGFFERQFLRPGRFYSETIDQPKFSAAMDIETARRALSFDKFYRDLLSVCTLRE